MIPATSRQRGVTLVELLVVTVVIAILASVAIPSYRSHTLKVRRSEAKVELTRTAQLLERCFTRFNAYNDANCVTGLPRTSEQGSYLVTGRLTATTFALTATPQGAQARDSACANLTLNQLDVKGVSGTTSARNCW